MAQCAVHVLKGLACRAAVLLAHAEVTENIVYCSMGPKLRSPMVCAAGTTGQTTAILEAGRMSLDNGSKPVTIVYDSDVALHPVALRLA